MTPTPEDLARDLAADLAMCEDHGVASPIVLAALRRALAGEAFKAWVHAWLDNAGVPHDPDPVHTAQHGCRISGRMNYLLHRAEKAEARIRELEAELEPLRDPLKALQASGEFKDTRRYATEVSSCLKQKRMDGEGDVVMINAIQAALDEYLTRAWVVHRGVIDHLQKKLNAAQARADEAVARIRELENEIQAAPHPTGNDGTDRLVLALHGRKAVPRDYLGGSNARMLHEAADEIARLRAQVQGHADRIAAQSELLTRHAELRRLVIDMRRYIIRHGLLIGECVAWDKLKRLVGVGQDHDCPSEP